VNDQELVRSLKKGDEAAFQVFYDRFFDAIYKFCFYRLGQNHTETEDVVGEVMLTAINKLGDLYEDQETSIFNWLAQIARFKLMETYRRNRRRDKEKLFSSFDEGLESCLEESSSVAIFQSDAEQGQTEETVGIVLNSLSEDYRRVLTEKYLMGFSVKEIAMRLRRSEKAVESLLTRSRDAFRRAHSKYMNSLEENIHG
jgi:RNA polymerase sigma-70 factor (ECF subfamily)